MKIKFFLVIAIMTGMTITCQAQIVKMDTIYVTTNNTVTVVLPQVILLCDIGSEDYGFRQSQNVLLLKAATEEARPASITVQYGEGKILHSTIAYKAQPKSLFIELKDANIPQFPNSNRIKESQDSVKDLSTKMVEKRLNILMSDTKIVYRSNAFKDTKEKIALTLQNIIQDADHLYLKVLFINDSKLDYTIDMVEFVYRDPLPDSKSGWQRKNVYATASNSIDQVRGKDMRVLGFGIPKFTLSKKGELLIVLREKNGSRGISLTLPFDLIVESKSIK